MSGGDTILVIGGTFTQRQAACEALEEVGYQTDLAGEDHETRDAQSWADEDLRNVVDYAGGIGTLPGWEDSPRCLAEAAVLHAVDPQANVLPVSVWLWLKKQGNNATGEEQ